MPDATVVENTNIPGYARPYVEEMLGVTSGTLFDRDATGKISGFKPYQQYGGERQAQFSDLQKQSFAGAGGLGPAAELDRASGMAQRAGDAAQGLRYEAGQFSPDRVGSGLFDAAQAQQYMSPYMQNVVNIQQREAQRQADIAGTRQQAQATQAGAFGGSRDAIMRAEAARNLALQQGDIQATGLQAAYQQAMGQFNADQQRNMQAQMANQSAGLNAQQLGEQSRQFGAGLQLQGAQTANQAASTLGQLGQTRFGQQTGAIGLQNQLGTQQQQQAQNILNTQYEDFNAQRNYPYQQLGFMSNMLRGLPLAQTATTSTPAQPSMMNQLMGLGTTAYGLSRLAGGGAVDSAAGLEDLIAAQILQGA
jgi:hypothetical protein